MNDSILVLGGNGFLGKHIIKSLIEIGCTSVSCGYKTQKKSCIVPSVKVDILDYQNVRNVCKKFDIIINCSGQITDPIAYCFLLNSEGMNNVVKVCNEFNKKLLQISSISVYGSCSFAKESSPYNPETPYAFCKSFSEIAVRSYMDEKRYCIVRCSNLYDFDSKGIFGSIYRSFHSDRVLTLDDNDSVERFYLHVKDCADTIVKLIQLHKDTGIYNVIGGEKYSIKQIISLIESMTGKKFEINKITGKSRLEEIEKISEKKLKAISDPIKTHSIRQFIQERL